MLVNTPVITVVNAFGNGRNMAYHTTQLQNVWWHGSTVKSVTDRGLVSAEVYKISIYPESVREKAYLPPSEWQACEERENFWTLRIGDFLVRGAVAGTIEKPADLNVYADVATIIGTKDLRSCALPYWRVEGRK